MHGMGNCAGLFAPTLTGVIIQATGTYSAAFVLTGVLGVAGALAVWGFVNEQKHPERQPALSAQ